MEFWLVLFYVVRISTISGLSIFPFLFQTTREEANFKLWPFIAQAYCTDSETFIIKQYLWYPIKKAHIVIKLLMIEKFLYYIGIIMTDSN